MIGSRFWLDVGEETEKQIRFLVVDPECPTIRDAAVWMSCGLRFLKDHLRTRTVEKVLVTPTNPVKLVIVYTTYPSFYAIYLRFTVAEFHIFRHQVCAPNRIKFRKLDFNWMKEGF
jgi:hypothetical protein